MNDNFNQEIFKAVDMVRKKNKQQANIEPILKHIIRLLEIKASQKHL